MSVLREMLTSTMALTAALLDALAQLQMSTEVEAEVALPLTHRLVWISDGLVCRYWM